MAQNGMFRNAFRGFNKQDVLQYIDEITAAWDEERKALEKRAEEAEAASTAAQAAAQAAADEAAAAVEQQQAVEAQLAEVQQKLTDSAADLTVAATTIEELATQLEDAQRRIAQLERELATTAEERDTAIATLADTKAQLDDAQLAQSQLEESRRLVNSQTEQITSMSRTIQRYEDLLGDVDTVAQRMDGIVRPHVDEAYRQSTAALDSAQRQMRQILNQLTELVGNMDASSQSLQARKQDCDSRLTAALDEWLSAAQGTDGHGSGFFR